MKLFPFAFLVLFLLSGCGSIDAVKLDSDDEEGEGITVASLNKKLADRTVTVQLLTGEERKVRNVSCTKDSCSFLDDSSGVQNVLPTKAIHTLQKREHVMGAVGGFFQGALIGAGTGAFVGLLTTMNGQHDWGVAFNVIIGGMFGTAVGSVTGLVVGTISGAPYTYRITPDSRDIAAARRGEQQRVLRQQPHTTIVRFDTKEEFEGRNIVVYRKGQHALSFAGSEYTVQDTVPHLVIAGKGKEYLDPAMTRSLPFEGTVALAEVDSIHVPKYAPLWVIPTAAGLFIAVWLAMKPF